MCIVSGTSVLLSCDPTLLWDVAAAYVSSIAILSSGDVISACGNDGLQVYDKKSGHEIQHPISDICEGYIFGVSVLDDGATVAAVEWRGHGTGRLHIYTSVHGGLKLQMYKICKKPRSVACTGNGHFIVGNINNSIYGSTWSQGLQAHNILNTLW